MKKHQVSELKESRKYAVGTIHEINEGELTLKKRFQ